jgi:type I restriction enzyme, S subunit
MELKPGYKQTEVGVIPDEWEAKHLGDLASVTAGGTPSRTSAQYWNGDIPWVTTAEVDFCSVNRTEQFITKEGLDNSPAKLLPRGTLLMALYGQGKTRGKVGILGIEAATNQACAAISLSRSAVPEFIFLFLSSQYDAIRKLSNIGNQENLNSALVRSIPVALPPPTEQRAIATALSDVDGLLGGLDRLIAKKRDLKQAAMQQLLTGQTRLPGFYGKWGLKRLANSCEVVTKGTTPTSIGRDFTSSGVNFLKAESISESGGTLADKIAFVNTATHKLLKRSQLKDGDLLISIAGVLGRIGRVTKDILPANTNQALAVIRLQKSSEIEDSFLFYCLRSPMSARQISDVNVQAAQANISLQNVRDLEISVPPTRAEQTAIAQTLSDMDTELTALEQRRDKTRALKQGTMQELLTGKTRLV